MRNIFKLLKIEDVLRKSRLGLGELLKKNEQGFAGVNVGGDSLKGLIVEDGKITDYFLEENKSLDAAVESLHSDKKISVRKIKICLKSSNCLVRCFSFPKMERKKMAQALSYELSKYTPFSSAEVYFDFYVLSDAGPAESLVLLAAAKKDFVDHVLEVFEKNNFEVSEISLDSVCLINLFLNNCPQARQVNACVLDMGYNFSTISLLHKGTPFITRDINFSARDIFGVAARVKNLTPVQVKEMAFSRDGAPEFLNLAQDNIANLCEEMKNSFDYFEVNKAERIDKLFLSGGLACVEGIIAKFSESLDMETEVLEAMPLSGQIKVGEGVLDEKLQLHKNSFSAVFGMVL